MNPSKYVHRVFLARFGLWGTCLVPDNYMFKRRGWEEPQCWACDKSVPLYICWRCALRRHRYGKPHSHDCLSYTMCIACFKDTYEDTLIAGVLEG